MSSLLEAVDADIAATANGGAASGATDVDVSGTEGGDNMLGLPGVFADHVMRDDSGAAVAAPEAATPPLPVSLALTWMEGLPAHLAALLPQPLRLADFKWQSYKQYLAGRADIFGEGVGLEILNYCHLFTHNPESCVAAECNHEVAEPVPPPVTVADAPASVPLASGLSAATSILSPFKCSVT